MKLESKALEFIYQDTQIHFLLGNEKNVMVNATEMAKAFDRRIDVFLKTEPTKAFINAVEFPPVGVNSLKLTRADLIVTKGQSGTYFHRILALKFAAWLDPNFEVWIYSQLEEVLFGKAKEVGNKISDAELKKIQIAELIKKVRDSGNETAISLLDNLEELKVIEKEKKKATAQFFNQFKIEFN
jgi:KilA-N domain